LTIVLLKRKIRWSISCSSSSKTPALAGLDHLLDLVAGDVRRLDRPRRRAGETVDLSGEIVEEDDEGEHNPFGDF